MRPLRFLLTLLTSVFAFLILVYVFPFSTSQHTGLEEPSTFGAYFNWRTPSSLFPPSAIISLTDDNSTFFLARPAAFGPVLPSKSLSGQLWVGSGFDFEDHSGVGGVYRSEGELGCSDVPGWDAGELRKGAKKSGEAGAPEIKKDRAGARSERSLDADGGESDDESLVQEPTAEDGTDDHLHHPLPSSETLNEAKGKSKKPTHADIQSLQESAEIAGKVVLLSRGGCGFLEKVKWVQRRGGVALIVGDDIRGGPLVTMYARGDTSNVTIPSLFTSHTTAHLLSSLIPSGGIIDGVGIEDAARLGFAAGDKVEGNKHTSTAAATKSSSTRRPHRDSNNVSPLRDREGKIEEEEPVPQQPGWLRSFFGRGNRGDGDASRPPSSGKLDWVLQDFEEEVPLKQNGIPTSSSAKRFATSSSTKSYATDGFQIGVQDWRDPDLVAEQKEQLVHGSRHGSSTTSAHSSGTTRPTGQGRSYGDSITPGSGEYGKKSGNQPVDPSTHADHKADRQREHTNKKEGNWLSRLFGGQQDNQDSTAYTQKPEEKTSDASQEYASTKIHEERPSIADGAEEHDGLWVTLTPTSMSSSPFFDTLLVLVVSPLVTLTVVYALLLLRSRIRRRRWRAPKSVVERLPVRTYQTMPSTTATTSSATSSISSPVTATTPLLPSSQRQGARPISARPRPRSRTTGEVPAQGSSLNSDPSMASPSLDQIEEKRAAGLAEWRRRYGGKQRECVVCLEEYVDGVSRVMSLPCGHEFHEGCITPWLTTRRRTCPICKGDVVRSLARNSYNAAISGASPTPSAQEPYRDDPVTEDEQEIQEQAATTHNDDPAAQQPVSREDEAFEDLERGYVDRNR